MITPCCHLYYMRYKLISTTDTKNKYKTVVVIIISDVTRQ